VVRGLLFTPAMGRSHFRFFLLWAGFVAIAAGCNPTFAPPPQSTHYGAAGRAETGQGELVAAIGSRGNGAVSVGLPLGPQASVELGADLGRSWVLGQAGLRFRLFEEGKGTLRFAGDATVGGAFGRGGELCGNQAPDGDVNCDGTAPGVDGDAWHDRLAGGAWMGGGIALHIDWFTPFLRTSLRVAKATEVPTTIWVSAMAGFEIELLGIDLYAGLGIAAYQNELDDNSTLFLEAGLSIPFGDAPEEHGVE
jgi:hypothetical protein